MKSNGRASGTTNLFFENGHEDYKNLLNYHRDKKSDLTICAKNKISGNPIDAIIPAGNDISIVLTESGEDYLPSACAPLGMAVNIDSSTTLSLPLIERGDNAPEWFEVPNWWDVEE